MFLQNAKGNETKMKIITGSIPDAIPIKFVSERSTYGTGFFTLFVSTFCEFFGIPNGLYSKKMQKAEAHAMRSLENLAASIGADGVMDVRCEIHSLSILVYGTAYKLPTQE
jgi:uncharacterized protein YbjQ (UPF0145 family)